MFSTTKVTTLLLMSLLTYLAIELMVMYKDPTEFRKRFALYKEGKKPYENGLPAYAPGKEPDYEKDTADFLKQYEGFRDTVYLDGKGIKTIGYGFTDPKFVNKGRITRLEADAELRRLIRIRLARLRDTLGHDVWDNLTNDSKKALTSYHFNYPAGFKDTTKFMLYWKAGNYPKAILEVDAGMNDKTNPGLKTRRLAELKLLNNDPFLNRTYKSESLLILDLKNRQWKPTIVQPKKEIPQDYPITVEAPESLNIYNNWSSPSYITRLPDILQFPLEQFVPTVLPIITTPLQNVILNDGNKIIRFRDGKLPRFVDGKDDIVYTVKKGDWLSKIARDKTSGMGTYHYLASYNNITDPDKIEIGQKIRIPKSIQKGLSVGSIEDTMIGRPQEDGLPIQQFRLTKFVPKRSLTSNKPRTIDLQLPDVVITGKLKPVQQEQHQPFEWKTPDEYLSSFILQEPQYSTSSRIVRPRTRGNVLISQLVEVPNSLRVNRLPENTRSIEELNEPSGLQYMYNKIAGKLGDVVDTVKENSGDLSGLFLTAWNGVMKYFVEDPEIKTTKRTLAPKKLTKTQKPSEVLDEAFAKGSRVDGDTLYWDRVPVDRTGNKYYLQSSYPITDDMRFGSRNRLDYRDLDSNNAPLTTYRPIYKYEDYIKGVKYAGKRYQAREMDSEGHLNHFMGYDKDGKFKIGPLSMFGQGDTMTLVFYSDIIGVPRDKNGNLIYTEDSKNPGRYLPVVDTYSENVYDENGNVVRGNRKKGVVTTMTDKKSHNGKYGNVTGGRALLVVDNEKRIVEGSIEHVILEIELMQKNHKGKPVRYYQLDNGSYNRGLRTRNNKNISALDLKDYDRQNTTTAGGGHFMYIKNK